MIDLDAIVTAVRPFSMVADIGIKFAAESAIDVINVPGVIVECGVWKGGCSMAMLLAQRMFYGRVIKNVVMFDSWQGMPAPGPRDGDAAAIWYADTASPAYFDNCRADRKDVERILSMFGFRGNGAEYEIVQGEFADTLPPPSREKIAILRLDADWYDATKTCLDTLGPRVSRGGIVIVDDYFAWEGCKMAVDEWLAARPNIELQAMPDQSAAFFRV